MKRRIAVIGLVVLILGASHVSFISANFGSREECLDRCQVRTDACFDYCSGPLVSACERWCSLRDDPDQCLLACEAVEQACERACEVKLEICTHICEKFFPQSPSDFGG